MDGHRRQGSHRHSEGDQSGACSGGQARNDADLDQGGGPRGWEETDLRYTSEVKPIELSEGLDVEFRERENSRTLPRPWLTELGKEVPFIGT